MPGDGRKLKLAFVRDHRLLIRAFRDIATALEAGDIDAAKSIANDVDQFAGAHIGFEEQFLYPIVQQSRGEPYAAKLYDEHSEVLQALSELREATVLTEANKLSVARGIAVGLDHAVTCGTLLSHLTTLPANTQKHLLHEYERLRREAKRWSQIDHSTNRDSLR